MRRLLLVSTLLVAAALFLTGTVTADNGPHTGEYTTTTDACAGCHRAHRGQAEKLLKEASQQMLCFSCHGSSASGADTNVEDGVYENRGSGGQYGTVGIGLRGGGFVNALMDTDWDGAAVSSPTTSRHLTDGTAGTMWGNGPISATFDPGKPNVSLKCGSCHNPHGRASTTNGPTYRVLRPVPTDSGASTGIDVTDQITKTYTLTDTALKSGNQYFGEDYSDQGDQLSDWCSQCHTRYLAPSGSGSTASGDVIFAYRHITQGRGCGCHDVHGGLIPPGGGPFHHWPALCITCHVAHGSSATMGDYSGSVEWPDNMPGGGSSDSRLLRVDNRGTCQLCHGL